MKVSLPGTDLELEFHVYHSDKKCEEWIQLGRPLSNNDERATKECCVVLEDGESVQVAGVVSGTFYQARFDLIVDGAFVAERAIDPPKEVVEAKVHNRRRIDFKTVYSADNTDTEDPPRTVDGEMTVTSISPFVDTSCLVGNGDAHGVGSMVLLISIEHDITPGYLPNEVEYTDCTIGAWQNREHEIRTSGSLPTHSIVLQTTGEVIKQRANQLHRQLRAVRPGYAPFARLIFHYRNKQTLVKHSMIAAPLRAYSVGRVKVEDDPVSSPPRKIECETIAPSLFTAYFPPRKVNKSEQAAIPVWDQLARFYHHDNAIDQLNESGHTKTALQWNFVPKIKEEHGEENTILEVAGQDYELPPVGVICRMIPKNGMNIKEVLHTLMPTLPRENRSAAAKLFLLYMRDVAALRYDQYRNQVVVKRCHLDELRFQSLLVIEAIARAAAAAAPNTVLAAADDLVQPSSHHTTKRGHIGAPQPAGRAKRARVDPIT